MARTGLTPNQIQERAIDIAIDQMRRYGFEKVRVVDVAKELGVTHPVLYKHFADKDALFDAVSGRWLKVIEASLGAILSRKKDPIAKIHEWFLKLYQMKREKVLDDPELYKSFHFAANAKRPFYNDHLNKMFEQLTGLIKEAQAEKKLAKHSVEKTLRILLEATTGFHNPALIARHLHEKREPVLKQVLDAVIDGLS